MGSFFDKIRTIRDGLFGQKGIQEENPIVTPSQEETREKSTLRSQERAPYYVQIGFDFGTSFSKCVYREVSKDKAWVYCPDFLDAEYPFLIPSAVIFHEGVFRKHTDLETQYPKSGLFHLKFAIERIACDDIEATVLSGYKKAIGTGSSAEVSKFVEHCGIFFLSTSLATIVKSIKSRFDDFGQHPNDQLAVNMAIPVADACQENISSHYKKILRKAWAVAQYYGDTDGISLDELSSLIHECDLGMVNDELCAVYPEVSANVQAFIRSPASSPDLRTIYFFSDTGAGTVDQSVFTYTEKLNYLAAEVLPLGSSHIDLKACGEEVTLENMEYWRKEKESGNEHKNILIAKQWIEEQLRNESHRKTLDETQKRLPTGEGVDPVTTLQRHVRLIFGGGGHSTIPYESGVLKSFRQIFNGNIRPDITSIQTPPDLELNGHGDSWMKRLFVAYGLSFPTVDLVENTYPDQNVLEEKISPLPSRIDCSCRGISPGCPRCFGRGWYD